jgi:carboxymethylenebutenolidase
MGEMIDFTSNGSATRGYLARPRSLGNGRGVLVLQERWGLVPHIKQVADRLASEGYTALAPDLREADTAPLQVERAERRLRDAGRALRQMGGVPGREKLAVVGFCMGGALSLYAACSAPEEIGACVDFYGMHPAVRPDLARLACPVLGFFGERDTAVPPAHARELQRAVERRGGRMDVVLYDAGHAFFDDGRPADYQPEPARDAWQKTLSFLAAHL